MQTGEPCCLPGRAEDAGLAAPDLLGQMLHSLSQPLTTLRCSLELSLDEFTERQCEAVSVALEQTDKAIEVIRLMREYLEVEQGRWPVQSVSLSPAVHAVLEHLSVLAEACEIPLLASGASKAVLAAPEFWLHRALRYLIGALIEDQPAGKAIVVLLDDDSSGHALSAHRLPCRASQKRRSEAVVAGSLRQVKVAIARRVLELAGASLEFYPDNQGFVLRVPPSKPLVEKLSA